MELSQFVRGRRVHEAVEAAGDAEALARAVGDLLHRREESAHGVPQALGRAAVNTGEAGHLVEHQAFRARCHLAGDGEDERCLLVTHSAAFCPIPHRTGTTDLVVSRPYCPTPKERPSCLSGEASGRVLHASRDDEWFPLRRQPQGLCSAGEAES
jgi:hypothetical protein